MSIKQPTHATGRLAQDDPALREHLAPAFVSRKRAGCGLRLSVFPVGNFLHRWDFTPQKPIQRACEQRPAAVKQWLHEEYPASTTSNASAAAAQA